MFVDLITDWRCSSQWWSSTSEYWWSWPTKNSSSPPIVSGHQDSGDEIWIMVGQIYLSIRTNTFHNSDKYKSMSILFGHEDHLKWQFLSRLHITLQSNLSLIFLRKLSLKFREKISLKFEKNLSEVWEKISLKFEKNLS